MSKRADRKVTVVGAGFSGLVTAYYLARAGYRVDVLEQASSPGGLIKTLETAHGRIETAANGLLNSTLVEELFRDLGVPLLATKKAARKRYIVRNGEARRWPLGVFGSLRILGFALRYFLQRKSVAPRAGESASAWAERTLGAEGARYLVEAALQGIYAGSPERMSANLLFGRFFGAAPVASPGDAARAPKIRGTVSAPEGMGQLIRALEAKVKLLGCTFTYGAHFKHEALAKNPVVIATAAHDAGEILKHARPEVAAALNAIELLPVVSCTAFFHRTDRSTEGFGCLFPPVENAVALGVLKNDFIFENRTKGNVHSETWILGGARSPEIVNEWSDEKIVAAIVRERSRIFDLSDTPIEFVVTRWPKAIPHYTVDLEGALHKIRSGDGNLWFNGNYLGQIGLAKILERASQLPDEIDAKGQWQ